MTRTVAIVGRPNVGKSTLFNRLVGGRRAIVDPTPGVTRDRIEGEGRLRELRFRVLDTAGLDLAGDELAERMRAQTLAALDEADVVLFLVDAREGITPLDRELAELLRRQPKPVVLVANKCEGRLIEAQGLEAWSLGLGEPVLFSARHGHGLDELAAALRPHLAVPEEPEAAEEPEAEAAEESGPVRLAVVGRPNTGKSSLINRILGSERLLTGPMPGLTRDAVEVRWSWRGRDFVLVDTAGLRKRARIEERLEKISVGRTLEAAFGADVAILVVDATAPLEHQDAAIARVLSSRGRPFVVALNKWDLVEDAKATGELVRERLERRLSDVEGVPVVPVSALTGRGIGRLLDAVLAQHERAGRKISTGRLNRWLQEAMRHHAPPSVDGRRAKLRYVTQTGVRPPRFVLFGNPPARELPRSYLRYLTRELRRAFDLPGIPVSFEVRAAENPYVDEDGRASSRAAR